MVFDNSAIALAARLKALGTESIMAERNAHAGDNWALRYDSMRFHIPTSFCHLPYMSESPYFDSDGYTASINPCEKDMIRSFWPLICFQKMI